MQIGYRSWLFLGTMVPVVTVALLMLVLVDRQTEQDVMQEASRTLDRLTGIVGKALEGMSLDRPGALHRYVEDSGKVARVRITVVDDAGVVLADSRLSADKVPSLDNHLSRPELRDAGRTGTGTAVRRSDTLGIRFMYLARKIEIDGRPFFARVSLPMSELSRLRSERRRIVLLASVVALLLAAAGAWWLSSRLAVRIAGIRDAALEIASGRLEEEGQLIRTILETMQEGVMAVSPEGSITSANQAICRISGYRGDPVGTRADELLKSPEFRDSIGEALAGNSVQREIGLEKPERRVLLLTATPLKSGKGTVVVLHDTTEVHSLHRMRRDFVANVSHELRNPVATIQAAAETLEELDREGGQSGDRQKLMGTVARQSERISSLVDDLLDLSRIESGQHELNPVDTDLSEAFRFASAAFDPRVEARGLRVEVAVNPAASACHCDWNGLQTVLSNLLDNAVKYTSEGGSIKLATYQARGGRVEIQISDSGPGIEQKHLPRLFERFYRVDRGRSRDLGGTGLGLAIVKHLAAAMDGSVGVRSHPDSGTTFTVNLPGPVQSSTNLSPPCHETDTESS